MYLINNLHTQLRNLYIEQDQLPITIDHRPSLHCAKLQ